MPKLQPPAPRRHHGTAEFSPCERYRYKLTRSIVTDPRAVAVPIPGVRSVTFVMLNPSTATADVDDPTIRRCIGYATAWGATGLVIVNLFALRATDPRELRKVDDPIGPENDRYIEAAVRQSDLTVCAWGAHGALQDRALRVIDMLSCRGLGGRLYTLTLTASGHPGHPLYLRGDLRPQPFVSTIVPDAIISAAQRKFLDDLAAWRRRQAR